VLLLLPEERLVFCWLTLEERVLLELPEERVALLEEEERVLFC
jgi:hypothetical protein